jgi:hypothetical protein
MVDESLLTGRAPLPTGQLLWPYGNYCAITGVAYFDLQGEATCFTGRRSGASHSASSSAPSSKP